jgi:hypothetical protein
MSALPRIEAAAEIMYGYIKHDCLSCGKDHLMPPWFKPFKQYCDECIQEQIEHYAGLDNERDVEEDL